MSVEQTLVVAVVSVVIGAVVGAVLTAALQYFFGSANIARNRNRRKNAKCAESARTPQSAFEKSHAF